MKKVICICLTCLLCFSFVGCGKSEEEKIVEEAIDELTEYWEDMYESNTDRINWEWREYLEILNTQVFKITDTSGLANLNLKDSARERMNDFKEIDYIVEFSLLTNYLRQGEDFVFSMQGFNCVIFYKDGSVKVNSNPLGSYFSDTYDFEFKGIDFERMNFGDKFNKVLIDKKHK